MFNVEGTRRGYNVGRTGIGYNKGELRRRYGTEGGYNEGEPKVTRRTVEPSIGYHVEARAKASIMEAEKRDDQRI